MSSRDGNNTANDERRRPQRPRIGGVYEWNPAGLDIFDSKVKRKKGDLVRVAKGSQFGGRNRLPQPFTYLEDPNTGEFLGMALDDSLQTRNLQSSTEEIPEV